MVFRRRGVGKRRMPMRKRVFAKRGLSTVKALARKVASLEKKTAVATERTTYQLGSATDVISPYAIVNLSNFNGWSLMWPTLTNPPHNSKSKMFWRYLTIDNNVTLDNINNEEGEIEFTYFIVSLKDAASSVIGTLASGVDYVLNGGKAYINLKKYNIHYVKRFTLTGGDGAEMQADRCLTRFTARIKVMKKVEMVDDNWKDVTSAGDPDRNYFAILFSNNAAGDLEEPRWSYNAVMTVDQ